MKILLNYINLFSIPLVSMILAIFVKAMWDA